MREGGRGGRIRREDVWGGGKVGERRKEKGEGGGERRGRREIRAEEREAMERKEIKDQKEGWRWTGERGVGGKARSRGRLRGEQK